MTFYALRIRKISISNLEFELEKSPDTSSVLNMFIDEIINFCVESSTYYFVFEDIDRFNCIDIFLNLREINTLINGNKLIQHKVVFIYCVKDGIFKSSEDRSKFFDFIISIVPIFNPNNGLRFVKEAIAVNGKEFEIDDSLIVESCFFIKEKRILNNVINDYILYHDSLEISPMENDKLFAMMVYKNLCEKDFSNLQSNRGLLFDVFNSYKTRAIEKASMQINSELGICEEKLKNGIEEDVSVSIKILKQRVNGILLEHGNTTASLSSIAEKKENNNSVIKYSSDVKCLYIACNYVSSYYGSGTCYKYLFVDQFKVYLENFTPYEKQENIISNSIETLRNKISELKKNKNLYRSMSVSKLISNDYFEEKDLNTIKSNKFLYYAVLNEYIDEGFFKFSGRQDTEFDRAFIDKVLTDEDIDPEVQVQNPTLVVSLLSENRFSTKSVLNYSILDCLLSNKKDYKEKKKLLINSLSVSRNSEFIIGYLQKGILKKELLYELKKENYSTLISDALLRYSVNDYALINAVREIIATNNKGVIDFYNQNNEIADTISRCDAPIENFFSLFKNGIDYIEFLKRIDLKNIEHLDDLEHINNNEINNIFKNIVEEALFEINSYNVQLITKYYFDKKTLSVSCFIDSKIDAIRDKASANIGKLIESVLDGDEAVQDDDILIENILKNESINVDLKNKYLLRCDKKIKYFDGLSLEIYKTLLSNNLLEPTFDSVSKLVDNNELDNKMVFNFVKNNISDFKDKAKKEIFIKLLNYEDCDKTIAESLCDYSIEKVMFDDIKKDDIRAVAIKNDLIDINSQNFPLCKGTIYSLATCLNKNHEFVDNLSSICSSDEEYYIVFNNAQLESATKGVVISKYYDKIAQFITDDNIKETETIVIKNPDNKYDYKLLSKLIINADIKERNALISICKNTLSNKEIILLVEYTDSELYKLLSNSENKIVIDSSFVEENIYCKLLIDKQIIRQTNRGAHKRNIYLNMFKKILQEK